MSPRIAATARNATRTKREPLSRAVVLQSALGLADREGLDALSMRRLGQTLKVEAMSLYNHVSSKDDLLDGIVDLVLSEMELPRPDDDWKAAMRRRARSARAVLSRHPWAIGLLESRTNSSSPRRLGYYDAVLGALRGAGFSNQLAMRAFSILDAYIAGFIVQERGLAFRDDADLQQVGADLLRQMADAYPNLTAVTTEVMATGYDYDREFAFGLELIIDGLERARAEPASPTRPPSRR